MISDFHPESDFFVVTQRIKYYDPYELYGDIVLNLNENSEITHVNLRCLLRFLKRGGFCNNFIKKQFSLSEQVEILCKKGTSTPFSEDLQKKIRSLGYIVEIGVFLGYEHYLPWWMQTPEISSGLKPVEMLSCMRIRVMTSLFYEGSISQKTIYN
jgi:hypothetical protein